MPHARYLGTTHVLLSSASSACLCPSAAAQHGAAYLETRVLILNVCGRCVVSIKLLPPFICGQPCTSDTMHTTLMCNNVQYCTLSLQACRFTRTAYILQVAQSQAATSVLEHSCMDSDLLPALHICMQAVSVNQVTRITAAGQIDHCNANHSRHNH